MNHYRRKFIDSFSGYPNWDAKTKAHAIELLVGKYAYWQSRDTHGISYSIEERIEEIREQVEQDLEEYLELEDYEICQILKDVTEVLI